MQRIPTRCGPVSGEVDGTRVPSSPVDAWVGPDQAHLEPVRKGMMDRRPGKQRLRRHFVGSFVASFVGKGASVRGESTRLATTLATKVKKLWKIGIRNPFRTGVRGRTTGFTRGSTVHACQIGQKGAYGPISGPLFRSIAASDGVIRGRTLGCKLPSPLPSDLPHLLVGAE